MKQGKVDLLAGLFEERKEVPRQKGSSPAGLPKLFLCQLVKASSSPPHDAAHLKALLSNIES